MATKRPTAPTPAPATEQEVLIEAKPAPAPAIEPEPEPEPEPEAGIEPFVIGPPSAPMTPGWLMGIGSRPQTPAEHATRLGASAGKFNDAGYILGTLAPRPAWPAQPVEAVPVST